jgi:spore germination protein GerM
MAAKKRTESKNTAKRRVRRTSNYVGRLIFFVLVMLAAGATYVYFVGGTVDVASIKASLLESIGQNNSPKATLYFADSEWTSLIKVSAPMPKDRDKVKRIKKLVDLLIEGPGNAGGEVFPKEAKVRNVYLGPKGLVVVDFEPTLEALRSYGASGEMLSVYALVHTICENVDGVDAVQILVGGKERETLAGHVRISEPLVPRPDLVGLN